ncbi:MAG: FkbM family methyltransferase [Polaromonas sp.]|uniref:FkbM family methyltransferase n=1 Tax=Polaromonas sp. TaxID=1869339 RepID=UPI002487F3F9|nr:FkbM family methyltransferase [Polaromonas sp.]MDI1270382.1 FkbM family methyltransferase [Polaromonas sp.]
MIKAIKNFVKSAIRFAMDTAVKTEVGRYLLEQVLSTALSRTATTQHNGIELTFAVPNSMNHFRIETFSTKEPETLQWIDRMEQGSVVWDIGANVGLYSCYAAKARGCTVFAFEPSVFNLELLARNIFLNDLTGKVTMMPLPLADRLATSTLNMSMTDWGGALSTFGESYSYDNKPLIKVFEFRTLGLSMDDAVKRLELAQPDYIKMDVDGIEHLILKGGFDVLAKVKGVLIEINEEFTEQSVDSFRYLSECGLELIEKRHSEMSAGTPVFNQIWRRAATR